MRFRRRRKPRVQWLANTGTDLTVPGRGSNPAECSSAVEINVLIAGLGEVVETPLVLDASPQEAQVGATLAVIQKQGLNFNNEFGYRLRRIVGKYYVGCAQVAQAGASFTMVWVKQGIMVRRVDPETGVSLALATGTTTSLDPTLLGNVSDPWVWQRSDFVICANQTTVPTGQSAAMTAITQQTVGISGVGGTKDGPAFDIKTARRLGPEERLFHYVSVQGLPLSTATASIVAPNLQFYLLFDYRVLGNVVTAAGNRRNASR